jgi:hypothetical protein
MIRRQLRYRVQSLQALIRFQIRFELGDEVRTVNDFLGANLFRIVTTATEVVVLLAIPEHDLGLRVDVYESKARFASALITIVYVQLGAQRSHHRRSEELWIRFDI